MVGFFHDVVGSSENHHHQKQGQATKRQQHIVQSGSSTLLSNVNQPAQASEIKEQIEDDEDIFENYDGKDLVKKLSDQEF